MNTNIISRYLQLLRKKHNYTQDELAKRYNNSTLLSGRTDIIDPAVTSVGEEAQGNVSTGTGASIEAQKQSRADYMKELETKQTTTTTTTK